MKLAMALVALAFLLVAPIAHAERIAQSGSFVIDLDTVERDGPQTPHRGSGNVLENPGFETGALPPWTTNNWTVTSADAQSGTYSAEDLGNFWVRQDFDPVDVTTINSVSLWTKQPEQALQAIDFYYSDTDFDEFLIFPLADWSFFDVTSQLRAVGNLQAIRIWGYSGGGPDPDLTRIDDIEIDAEGVVPVLESTWGRVKQIYR
jgi:hypothetical protein